MNGACLFIVDVTRFSLSSSTEYVDCSHLFVRFGLDSDFPTASRRYAVVCVDFRSRISTSGLDSAWFDTISETRLVGYGVGGEFFVSLVDMNNYTN